jgi:Signal peptidase, peptidase S26
LPLKLRPRSRFQRFEQIPPHHIWVEGDNAGDSEDSNHHGPISKKLMIGKAERIVWPPSRWNSIERVKPMAGKAWWP